MEITLTHNSELRLRKVDALHRINMVDYPVSGDNHYPSIGEEVEVAKTNMYLHKDRLYGEALGKVFKKTQDATDLTRFVDHMENQEALF